MIDKKKTIAAVAAFVLMGTAVYGGALGAAAAPAVRMRIESKLIDITDIPEDHVVTLEVYADDLPPCFGLGFMILKDPRLEYASYQYLERAPETPGTGYINYDLSPDGNEDFIYCKMRCYDDTLIENGGVLARLSVVLPQDVQVGDVFTVEMPSQYGGEDGFYPYLRLTMAQEDFYWEEAFAQFESGGVTIVGEEAPPPTGPPPADVPPPEAPPDPVPQQDTPAQPAPAAAAETTAVPAATATHVSTTTAQNVQTTQTAVLSTGSTTATTKKATQTTTSATSTVTETETTMMSQTETTTTTPAPAEPEGHPPKVMPWILMGGAGVSVLTAAAVILIKKKK